jgi:hypothetical protein
MADKRKCSKKEFKEETDITRRIKTGNVHITHH